MIVRDKRKEPKPTLLNLRAIPKGTVFTGTIGAITGTFIKGLETMVINLETGASWNVGLDNQVENYESREAELILK